MEETNRDWRPEVDIDFDAIDALEAQNEDYQSNPELSPEWWKGTELESQY